MNTTLRKICDLLRGPGPDRQRAAALVLAEIAPHDAGVVRALCDAIDPAARPLTLACVEALGRIRSPGAVPALLGLIESADDEIREVATHALIGIGSGAVRPISRQIADAPPATRRALLGVLGGVKSAESIRALLSLVQSGHPEAAAEAADAIVALSAAQNRSEKAKLRGLLEKCLRVPPDKAPDGSLRAALRAIPAVAIPSTTTMLLRMAGPKYPEEVRRDALLSLARVIGGGPMPLRLFEGIYPLLHDGPSPVLRSTALEVIGAVTLPASAGPSLLKLLDNPDPAVRRLVARRLGDKGLGGVRVVRRLIPLLTGGDPALREAAAESLARLPEAMGPLVEELLASDGVHRTWNVAHVLKAHAARIRRPTVRRIFDAAVRALTTEDRVWEPLLHVVRQCDPELMYAWLMEASARFRKARKYSEAEACLVPLTRGDHFDSEARFALAMAGLRASRSRSGVLADAPIDLVRQLVRDPAFPLVDRIKKERGRIETKDLYTLGFKLAEGSMEEKEAGAELLRTVAARAGSTKLGRSARSKLRAEGLAV